MSFNKEIMFQELVNVYEAHKQSLHKRLLNIIGKMDMDAKYNHADMITTLDGLITELASVEIKIHALQDLARDLDNKPSLLLD